MQAFADDITVTIQGSMRAELENRGHAALELIRTWSNKYKVTFNKDKSYFMTLENHYKKRPPTVKLGAENLKHETELKILGVIIDRKLSFIPHAEYLKNKTYKNTIQLATFTGQNGYLT